MSPFSTDEDSWPANSTRTTPNTSRQNSPMIDPDAVPREFQRTTFNELALPAPMNVNYEQKKTYAQAVAVPKQTEKVRPHYQRQLFPDIEPYVTKDTNGQNATPAPIVNDISLSFNTVTFGGAEDAGMPPPLPVTYHVHNTVKSKRISQAKPKETSASIKISR